MSHALRRRRLVTVVPVGVLAAVAVAVLGIAGSASAHGSHSGHKGHDKGHHQGRQHGRRGGGGLSITSEDWPGMVPGVKLFTLSNGNRMTVKITNYGGVVQSIWVPDRHGKVANVALGFSKLDDYVNDFTKQPWPAPGGSGNAYFGAIIGRYANRIADAEFSLNGTDYPLGSGPPCPASPTPNNGPNLLHGGPNSYNTQVWKAGTSSSSDEVSLTLTYTDPDCKNGFPGTVQNQVIYSLTKDSGLKIEYRAMTDKPTVVNFTNHSYFNLAGEGSGTVYDQLLQLNANTFTPVDQNLIPTGVFASVAGTPFDFRHLKPIGQDIRRADMPQGDQLTIAHGYDHNWVLNGSGFRLVSTAEDPVSGRVLKTYTTEPGVQFYTGNFLVGDLVGSSRRTYRQGDGFTLETQHYPDSPHHQNDPNWPSVVLNPGQVFTSTTEYAFSTTNGHHGHHGHHHHHH
jgi:aldose 1-epimerase